MCGSLATRFLYAGLRAASCDVITHIGSIATSSGTLCVTPFREQEQIRCVLVEVHGGSYDADVDDVKANADAAASLVDNVVGIGTGNYVGAESSHGAGNGNRANNDHCDSAESGNGGRSGQWQR